MKIHTVQDILDIIFQVPGRDTQSLTSEFKKLREGSLEKAYFELRRLGYQEWYVEQLEGIVEGVISMAFFQNYLPAELAKAPLFNYHTGALFIDMEGWTYDKDPKQFLGVKIRDQLKGHSFPIAPANPLSEAIREYLEMILEFNPPQPPGPQGLLIGLG